MRGQSRCGAGGKGSGRGRGGKVCGADGGGGLARHTFGCRRRCPWALRRRRAVGPGFLWGADPKSLGSFAAHLRPGGGALGNHHGPKSVWGPPSLDPSGGDGRSAGAPSADARMHAAPGAGRGCVPRLLAHHRASGTVARVAFAVFPTRASSERSPLGPTIAQRIATIATKATAFGPSPRC